MINRKTSFAERFLEEIRLSLKQIEKFQYNRGIRDFRTRLIRELPEREGTIERIARELQQH